MFRIITDDAPERRTSLRLRIFKIFYILLTRCTFSIEHIFHPPPTTFGNRETQAYSVEPTRIAQQSQRNRRKVIPLFNVRAARQHTHFDCIIHLSLCNIPKFPWFCGESSSRTSREVSLLHRAFFLFVVLKTSIFIKLFKTERGTKKAEKRERQRERERIRIRRCVRLPTERSRRVPTRSIDRSIDNDNYTQVSSSSRAMTRRRKKKKEKTTSLFLRQSRRRKKTTFRRESCEGVRHENDAMHAPKSSPSLILLRRGAD